MAFTEYRLRGRPLSSLLAFFFLMYINHFFLGTPAMIALNLMIWITFSSVLFLPKSWWTRWRLIAAGCLLAIESAVGIFYYHESKIVYFLSVLILAVVSRFSLSRSPLLMMSVLFVMAVFYSHSGSNDFFHLASFVLLSVVIYFSMRNRAQRNELYELNKRQLVELQEAYDQLQEASATAMQYAVLEERTRIARDMHDSVGHSLTSLIVQLQAFRYMIKENPEKSEQAIEEMLVAARQGLNDIRSSVHALADDRSGSGLIAMQALLTRMEATASIRWTFHSDIDEEDTEAEAFKIFFRVLQEAVTNIIRHAEASQVDVTIARELDHILMRVRDNGMMKPDSSFQEGFGLQTMKKRLADRGGTLRYAFPLPHGFELIAELPARDPDQDEEKDG